MSKKGEEWKCQRCGRCCRTFNMKIQVAPRMQEFLKAKTGRHIEVVRITMPQTCRHLDENNQCRIYGTGLRPQLCRDYKCDDMGSEMVVVANEVIGK